ncbi:hypothetical protein LJPFL01_2225 [Lelliottia jeotgali]|nr:hypothetical protein LJPFL01_2225 [Lelliottia jeotgali]
MDYIPYSLTLTLQHPNYAFLVYLNAVVNQLEHHAPHLASHEGYAVIRKFITFHTHLLMFY